jgi:glutamyl-Q tRNA(Asp) synthetase
VSYVGRFAPSPTGPLHLGSLVTAVASFLHARQAHGEWLLRIEDIDPPREIPGAAGDIQRTLEALGLEWDRQAAYQSSHLEDYRRAAEQLLDRQLAFRCRCTRSELRAGSEGPPGPYPGTCRERAVPPGDAALRARVEPGLETVDDQLQGLWQTELSATMGDYVIVRRDGLPAYHLAVVLDDAAQDVTTVVRGVDLLESTAAHVHLQRLLGLPRPRYYHLPVIVNALGQKLSKQNGAEPVDVTDSTLPSRVLTLLGLNVPHDLREERPTALWRWALDRWSIDSLQGRRTIAQP